MSEAKTSNGEILVHLLIPGVGAVDYHLAEGATLADLLRLSGASTTNRAVFLGDVLLTEGVPLPNDAVVAIVARPRNAAREEPWRAAVPAFRNEVLFQEYCEALKAHREGDEPEA